jgi:hypothetical protein
MTRKAFIARYFLTEFVATGAIADAFEFLVGTRKFARRNLSDSRTGK